MVWREGGRYGTFWGKRITSDNVTLCEMLNEQQKQLARTYNGVVTMAAGEQ